MSAPGRAVEWLAITAVVGIGLAAAFYLAPGPSATPEPYQAPSAPSRGSTVAQASAVRYGVADRSEIMGRGAGPVYNLRASRGSRSSGAAAGAAPTATTPPLVEDPE